MIGPALPHLAVLGLRRQAPPSDNRTRKLLLRDGSREEIGMAKQMVSELEANERVTGVFVVKEKNLLPFRKKSGHYLNVILADRSGEIPGRVWDNAEQVAALFGIGDVVSVRGQVEEYQGQRQVIIQQLQPADPSQYDKADFVKTSPRPPAEMLQQLHDDIETIQEPHLQAVVQAIFGDEEIRARFAQAPGAKAMHHAYVGGLLEHTLNVVELVETAAELHPELNRDLLVAAALLHDLGKIYELDGEMVLDYTNQGRLVGHVVITDRIVGRYVAQLPEFPSDLADLLCHMLLSHHGEREWGAPIEPAIPEAIALHYADNLDARVAGYEAFREERRDQEGQWAFHKIYERSIFLGPTTPGSARGPGRQTGPLPK